MTSRVPNYALYGDRAQPNWLDVVHSEQIPERSSMFNFVIHPHVHDGLIQVLYLTRGGGQVTIDGETWQATSPCLIVVPSHHVHGFQFDPDVDGPVITAAQRPLESLMTVAAPEMLVHIRQACVVDVGTSPRYRPMLLPLFDAIDRESRVQGDGDVAVGTAILTALFVQIGRIIATLPMSRPGHARSRSAMLVERFRAYVDQHYADHWSIERYANELGVTAGQLSRLCRQTLGRSAMAVVTSRLVHEAERELVYSKLTVKQVASLLGFEDEAYFGRFFKKHTGQTPTDFRRSAWHHLALTPGSSDSVETRDAE